MDRDKFITGIVALLVGLVGVYGMYIKYENQQSDIENSVQTEGTVQNSYIEEEELTDPPRTNYEIVVEYSYRYDGKNYTSDTVYPGDASFAFKNKSAARDAIEKYQNDRNITVYVNSEKPNRAFLIKEGKSDRIFLFFSIPFVVFSLFGIVSLLQSLGGSMEENH